VKKKRYIDPLHVPYSDLTIEFNKPEQFILNSDFMDRQNAWKNLEELKEAYWFKLMFYSMMEDSNDIAEMRSLVEDLTELEFYIQELFNFPKDQKFHRFWETPRCKCPELDNQDAWPSGIYRINTLCPLHGFKGALDE
jgi:hypothetical protein